MKRPLLAWSAVTLSLGVVMAGAGIVFRARDALRGIENEAYPQVIVTGLALVAVALSVLLGRRRVAALLTGEADPSNPDTHLVRRHPYSTLFIVSFVVLFFEVALIRYTASQIRIFSFYKNIPLVSCFLGLGLGCYLGGGRGRHALSFLLWLLPLSAFLAQGSSLIGGTLAIWANRGSSEQILGGVIGQYQGQGAGGGLSSQLFMGLFCVATLVSISLLFASLGRLLGAAFETVPRLPGYTVNIVGSLAGILGFVALSYLRTPPWIWLLVGLAPLLWWLPASRRLVAAGVLLLGNVLLVMPSQGETVWSPYQKLVGHVIPPEETGTESPAYLVQISDVFYQVAVDLRPEAWARLGKSPFPHYDVPFRNRPAPGRVLVVGAGTGNDVAAALRAGAKHVDAVDIDPAIIGLGRLHHPEDPYDDARVTVIVDDARNAFRKLEPASYDVVIFGLLDSHTQLGISSVRLDNYVFTLESFASARRLVRSGGILSVCAETQRRWFFERLTAMVAVTCEKPPKVIDGGSTWLTYLCEIDEMAGDEPASAGSPADRGVDRDLPSDDWPFLYLPGRGIPQAYVVALGLLVTASVLTLRAGGLPFGQLTAFHAHFFFLGAAFLLLEVYAINRLALLFGTTWLVSAVAISLVLILIVAGNLTALFLGRTKLGGVPYPLAYGALVVSLLTSWYLDPSRVLGADLAAALGYGLALLSPVYFAALIFARSFAGAQIAGTALGANILGSVLGGWAEYATMITGIRAMALVALVFYLVSLLALLRQQRPRRRESAPESLADGFQRGDTDSRPATVP